MKPNDRWTISDHTTESVLEVAGMGDNQITVTSGVFRELAACLEGLEFHGVDIVDVAPHEDTLLSESEMVVDLTVAIPLMPERESCSFSINTPDSIAYTSDGTIRFELTVEVPLESANKDVNRGIATADLAESVTAETANGDASKVSSDSPDTDLSTNGAADDTSTDEPAYRDPERLAEVYEQYETFEEMTEALDVAVTAQTVRRHMIDHGIHDPSPREMGPSTSDSPTADSGENPEPPVETSDDIDLPADISVAELVDAVQSSRTIRETSHRLNVDVNTTRNLLMELELLDLVMGRIDTGDDREISAEEVEERIKMASES